MAADYIFSNCTTTWSPRECGLCIAKIRTPSRQGHARAFEKTQRTACKHLWTASELWIADLRERGPQVPVDGSQPWPVGIPAQDRQLAVQSQVLHSVTHVKRGQTILLPKSLDEPGLVWQDWPMPRQLRIEYAGAIYHVMSRGDRRKAIFLDDVDRQDFLKTLAETCQKTSFVRATGAPSFRGLAEGERVGEGGGAGRPGTQPAGVGGGGFAAKAQGRLSQSRARGPPEARDDADHRPNRPAPANGEPEHPEQPSPPVEENK